MQKIYQTINEINKTSKRIDQDSTPLRMMMTLKTYDMTTSLKLFPLDERLPSSMSAPPDAGFGVVGLGCGAGANWGPGPGCSGGAE